jgi:hypothetical protein
LISKRGKSHIATVHFRCTGTGSGAFCVATSILGGIGQGWARSITLCAAADAAGSARGVIEFDCVRAPTQTATRFRARRGSTDRQVPKQDCIVARLCELKCASRLLEVTRHTQKNRTQTASQRAIPRCQPLRQSQRVWIIISGFSAILHSVHDGLERGSFLPATPSRSLIRNPLAVRSLRAGRGRASRRGIRCGAGRGRPRPASDRRP